MQFKIYRLTPQTRIFPDCNIPDGPDTCLMAFGPATLSPDAPVLRAVRDRFPDAAILGASGSAIILGAKVLEDDLAVLVIHTDGETWRVAHGDNPMPIEGAPQAIGFYHSEPDDYCPVEHMALLVRPDAVVGGGQAGASSPSGRPWILRGGEIHYHGRVAVRVPRSIRLQTGVAFGWRLSGGPHLVAEAVSKAHTTIIRLKGRRTLAQRPLWQTPLWRHRTQEAFAVLRASEDGLETNATHLEVGETFEPMHSRKGDLTDADVEAAVQATAGCPPGSPLLVIAGTGRLQQQPYPQESLLAIQRACPGHPVIGFYAYGEFVGRPVRRLSHHIVCIAFHPATDES